MVRYLLCAQGRKTPVRRKGMVDTHAWNFMNVTEYTFYLNRAIR